MASLQKVEGSVLCKIILDQTGVKLLIFLGKEWTVCQQVIAKLGHVVQTDVFCLP